MLFSRRKFRLVCEGLLMSSKPLCQISKGFFFFWQIYYPVHNEALEDLAGERRSTNFNVYPVILCLKTNVILTYRVVVNLTYISVEIF